MTMRIERLASVDSTNAEAMRRAAAGERGPLWIAAESQGAGRGRAGRSWASGAGNVQASLLITLATPAPRAYQLSLVAGVAVFDAITATMSPPPATLRLKWPNDLLIDGDKAGGILIESSTFGGAGGGTGLAAVIGIGLNVASHPENLDRPATHLAAHGRAPDAAALLAAIAEAMRTWLAIWAEGEGFATIRDAWLSRAHPIGERMSINAGSERLSGLFMGVDNEGALILEIDGDVRRFTFGDVYLER